MIARAMSISASVGIIVIFVILAFVSQVFNWPTWLTIVAFIGLFVLASIGMTLLTIYLRPDSKEDEDVDE